MSIRPTLVIVFLTAISLLASSAQAVVVELQAGGQVIYGRLVRLTPQLLVVDQLDATGTSQRRELSRLEIAKLTLNVSDDRLSTLQPEQPEAYFQYAQELFPLREDPDARQAATRLYLIAGHLAPERFGDQALARLIVLARSQGQARTFRAMRYLRQADDQTSSAGKLSDTEDAAFLRSTVVNNALQCIAALRQGDRRAALGLLNRADVRHAIDRFHGELKVAQLQQIAHGQCEACIDGRVNCDRCGGSTKVKVDGSDMPCTHCRATGLVQCSSCRGRDFFTRPANQIIQKLLALELDIRQQRTQAEQGQVAARQPAVNYRNWAHAQHSMTPAVTLLDWTNVTQIDPRESVYVGNQWVRP